ncbi:MULTISPECIES: N-acetylmuramoyl-L-alanine amidase [Winogradskyella]|uniref:N-acetylmuramoyl-L-alanine amidase n=1 Tax=Winogradskyella TaxID=286104 RepID=UPI0015C7E4C2|nr:MULTISPECIES: N-acetylmuramoyl-L-alanine amidase [Winogradskyella]
MINYFIYTVISLGCSYAVYFLLLRKQKTFQFNRFFLIGSILLCLVAPFIEIELFNAVPSITEIPLERITESTFETPHIEAITFDEVTPVHQSSINPVFIIYFMVSGFFMLRFLKNLLKIYKLTRHDYKRVERLKIITVTDSDMVSSFFNYMFIPENHVLSNDDYLSVLAHETVHSEEYHTLDIILLELLKCIFWFNPFIWMYNMSILQNHEYLADEQSVLSGIAIENYSNTIINLGQKEYRVPLTSGFNFIQIKNRIIMLHQSKSSVFKRTLNIISVSLLLAGIFVLSSYKDLKEPLVVVIDAGHGGHDSGNLDEKNIVLNISHQLSLLSSDNIRIITTRTEDTFLTLQERVEFINTQNADLVVSLHANAHSNPLTKGVEAYYNDKDEFKDKSYAFGKILLENQMELFSTNRGLKTVPMYIFRHINSPGVLLELGFITNEEDHKVLMNVDRQKQIAASIFEGLEEIRKSN